jgi:hypothetical protein
MGRPPHAKSPTYVMNLPDLQQIYVSIICDHSNDAVSQLASFVPGLSSELPAWAEETSGFWDAHTLATYTGPHKSVTRYLRDDQNVPARIALRDRAAFRWGDSDCRLAFEFKCVCGQSQSFRMETLFAALDDLAARQTLVISLHDLAAKVHSNSG